MRAVLLSRAVGVDTARLRPIGPAGSRSGPVGLRRRDYRARDGPVSPEVEVIGLWWVRRELGDNLWWRFSVRACSRSALQIPQVGVRLLVLTALGLATVSIGCGADPPDTVDGPTGQAEPVGPGEPVGSVGPVGPVGSVADGDAVAGSGDLVIDTRHVGGFTEVVLAGEGAVEVVVGDDTLVTVETDDNLLEFIHADVRAGVLEISTTAGVDIAPTRSVRYVIEAPALDAIVISGAGSYDIDQWRAEQPRVELIGVGDISITALQSTTLTVEHHGVGSITISGTTTGQRLTMSGVGEYNASDLESAIASVEASGPAAATLWVTEALEVTATDTSAVSYFGSPDLAEQVDDLASLVSLGER